MSIGGIGAVLAHMKNQKPTQKCGRCGLLYPKDLEICSHCGDLDENGLKKLLETIEDHHESNSKLGILFAAIAGLIILGLIAIAL